MSSLKGESSKLLCIIVYGSKQIKENKDFVVGYDMMIMVV